MSKHTPGPWEVKAEEIDRLYIRIRGTRLGGRFKIANVIIPDYEDSKGSEAAETRANARLIAAAPELLRVLQEIVDRGLSMTRIAEARALIAQATGEQA